MAGDRQEFLLPTVDEGATRATVVRWLVAPGDRVLVDRPICLVDVGAGDAERLLELTSPYAGTVVALGAGAGEALNVGELLVTVEADGASVERGPKAGVGAAARGGQQHSPLVRRLATDFGVDLTTLHGTGPGGRITRADVQRAAFPDDPLPGTDPFIGAGVPTDFEVRGSDGPLAEAGVGPAAEEIAETVTEPAVRPPQASGQTFAVSATADAGQLLRAHERLAEGDDGPVAMDALLVRIVAMAVRDLPLFTTVDTAVAVGFARLTDNRLVEATISAPHDLPLADLDRRMHQLMTTAQRGESSTSSAPPSVTVIDAGGLGMTSMAPLLAPGAAATIAFGRPEPRPWLVDGAVRNGWVLTATGTFDSATVDVALASLLLRRVRLYAEDPILAFAS